MQSPTNCTRLSYGPHPYSESSKSWRAGEFRWKMLLPAAPTLPCNAGACASNSLAAQAHRATEIRLEPVIVHGPYFDYWNRFQKSVRRIALVESMVHRRNCRSCSVCDLDHKMPVCLGIPSAQRTPKRFTNCMKCRGPMAAWRISKSFCDLSHSRNPCLMRDWRRF